MNPALAQTSELASQRTMPPARVLRAYVTEAKYESLRMLRAPAFAATQMPIWRNWRKWPASKLCQPRFFHPIALLSVDFFIETIGHRL